MFASLFGKVALNQPLRGLVCLASCDSHDKLLVRGRQIQAASVASGDSCEFATPKFYFLCSLGGILSCGTTHTFVCPLDVVKCRLQVNKAKYQNIGHGFKVTIKEEGVKGLYKGWAPTFFGYSLQGAGKFGLYEFFKHEYAEMLSEENSYTYRSLVYLAGAASAEFFADIMLAPLESIKVRIQTIEGYANTMREALPKMMAEGIGAFYTNLVPLWCRQIPYTMMKFASFEKTVELLYRYAVPKPREKCSKGEQLVVTFTAGYIAGVFCAIVSHPADTLVSKMSSDKQTSAGEWIKKLGWKGLWSGLGLRIVMIGTLTALQWFIYDGFKVYMRMPRPAPAEMPASMRARQKAE